ncbi:MAG: DNRLRE domain-containing protein [Gaiellaceae bacterium]
MTKRLFIAVLLVALAVAANSPGAFAQTVNASADSWVTERYPSRNYGTQSTMRSAHQPRKRTFVRFEIPALDGSVEHALLRIYSRNGAPSGLRVFSTAAGWGEQAITFGNAPAAVALVTTVPGFSAQGTWRTIDVTDAVTGSGALSFLITAPDASRDVFFASREGGRAPQLVLTTDGSPPPPTPDPDPDPDPDPGTVITTNRPWSCTGSLASFGPLPVKVVSTIANAGANDNDNAVNLRGCYGDANPATVDLILDVRGNGADIGTSYDVVRIGQNAHDLVVTGNAECGARNSDSSIHQDIVQALSGSRVTFVDFTSGDPFTGRWTCWGAGGGWYITWANAGIPTDLICLRCILATYNQNLRIGESIRSGARDSVFGYSRSYGIFVESVAQSPVNENNQVIHY